ncbi:MAG: deazaflavin-dependent oxidoreductase (nitroreductase family) [Halioglobus sp.]|jgi:deazaflavin-dependent oxidoreductase (nitroreductase family)
MADSIDPTTDKGSAPPPRWVLKTYTRVNVFVYRLTGGRLMNTLAGLPIVLVKMKGAKSGKMKTIPLMYVPHEKGVVLVASQGGAPKHPVWYHNLVKNPQIEVTQGGTRRALTARRVSDEEKAELWPTCVKYYPPFQQYQNRTERNIPVFLCE